MAFPSLRIHFFGVRSLRIKFSEFFGTYESYFGSKHLFFQSYRTFESFLCSFRIYQLFLVLLFFREPTNFFWVFEDFYIPPKLSARQLNFISKFFFSLKSFILSSFQYNQSINFCCEVDGRPVNYITGKRKCHREVMK